MTSLLPVLQLLISTSAEAGEVEQWQPMIEEASRRFGVPATWIERVMQAESRGRTMLKGRPIRSRAGAMGLMQLMPATWAEMRARLALGGNPDDPRDNIVAGAFYLRLLHDRFGYPGVFGAYNAGPAAYAAWLAGRRRLPGETITYLRSVGGIVPAPSGTGPRTSAPALFVVRRTPSAERISSGDAEQLPSLFAVRKVLP